MMSSEFEMMNFAFQMMNFVFLMRSFAFQMINSALIEHLPPPPPPGSPPTAYVYQKISKISKNTLQGPVVEKTIQKSFFHSQKHISQMCVCRYTDQPHNIKANQRPIIG